MMQNYLRLLISFIALISLFRLDGYTQQDRRFVAEWERAWGTLIRWPLGIPSSLVVELAKDDSLYVLVANQSEINQATNTFSAWGVNLNHTRFIIAATNTHWTRDWGPHFVFDEAGECGIADPYFDGYPWVPGCFLDKSDPPEPIAGLKGSAGIKYADDNLVNGELANEFECPLISLPIYLTGGNVMVDGRNTAISTRQMLDENFPGFSEAQFRQFAEDSLGITHFIIVENPEVNGIQHIDCFAKYLNETTILVKEVGTWHPEYACCEALASHLETELNCYGEPYNIIRIFCGSYSGNNTAAYTNSLILNKKVLVPLFSISSDATAIQTYQDAMPGYEVIGFPWGSWYYFDALHCRTMGIFDFDMLYIRHDPLTGIQPLQNQYDIQAEITAHSNAALFSDSLLIIYSIHGGDWDTISMSLSSGNVYTGQIPVPVPGSEVSYYLFAADQSGRREFHPIIGQPDPHTFYAGSPASPEMVLNPLQLEVSLPVDGTTTELINIQNNGPVSLNFTAAIQYNTKSINSVEVSPIPENYRTGSTTASAFTQTSLVRGAPPFEAGWMTFDISPIPVGSTINSIVFNGFVNATNWPYWNINPVSTDPMNTTPSVLYNDIIAEANAGFYLFREEPGGYTTGWKTHTLGGSANADMETALGQGWFAIGIIDRDFDESTYYIHFDGWAEANPPYLIVNYTYTVQQSWLTIDGGTTVSGSVPALEEYALTVGFDASELEEGIYSANILISSNDPVQPEVFIPVTLDVVSGMEAELKIWLEGPFEVTDMHTLLNQSGLIPLSQPYAVDPWNYGGMESVGDVPNPDVVDWLLVEFHDSPDGAGAVNPQNRVEAKACFILNDGRLVDLDGSSPLRLNAASGDDLFAVVRHRNHPAVISANPLPRSDHLYQLDFTTGENTVFGGQAVYKELTPDIWGMLAGDADADGQITLADKTGYWELQSGETGYLQADHNLDGEVDNRDKNDLWFPNHVSGFTGDGAYDTIWIDCSGNSGVIGNDTGSVVISNLKSDGIYSLMVYASRMEVADNRESIYIATGANTLTGYLDAANNEMNTLWLSGIQPDASENTRIDIARGPENPIISWSGINLPDPVIEYSVNEGVGWLPFDNVSQDQSYPWTIPDFYSENPLERATSDSYSDHSDAAFTISNIQCNCNIVVLGSSTAAGVGPLNPDSAWVSRFEYALKQVNPNFEVINLAVGGYTTFQVLPTGYPIPPDVRETIDVNRNITAALAYEPLVVIVNMPSNDASKNYSVSQQLDNFNAVSNAAALEGVPVWFTTSQPRNFSDPVQIAIQFDLAETIPQVYGSYAIDFWNGLAGQDGYINTAYDSGDGIHLNDETHRILFNRVWAKQFGNISCTPSNQ